MPSPSIRKERVCFCSCCFFVLVIFLLLASVQRANLSAFLEQILTFWPRNELVKLRGLNDVLYLDNVCIEYRSVPATRAEANFSETKKLVAYGNYSQILGLQHLSVAGSPNSRWNHWDIEFRRDSLSVNSVLKFHSDTAFFVQPTCPGNFHHFFIDEFLPLYSVVREGGRLYPGADNQILYRTPPLSDERSCEDRQRYEPILRTLYVKEQHDVFYSLPPNSCFRKSVFGSRISIHRQRDAVDHVLARFSLPRESNQTGGPSMTILSRQRRRILNERELRQIGLSVGFRNVSIVDFERLTVEEQLAVAASTDVLVGVQGAGLQWAVFMPEGSHLVEIAWPSKHWVFYYRQFVTDFGINYHTVEATDVRVNWTSYETSVRRGIQLSDDEKIKLLRRSPSSTADNLWKWADVFVVEEEIQITLQDIYSSIKSRQ